MKPLIDKRIKLERFPGKGGWTYARIPADVKQKMKPFGWVRVCGTIEGYEISRYHLMPMGNGKLFLPVKAQIRKRIRKEEGDLVHIVLFPDDTKLKVPGELLTCLKDEPEALRFFNSLSDSEKNYYIKWIYSAKREETKINRMIGTIDKLVKGRKMYEKQITW